jgi:hypothetical protein
MPCQDGNLRHERIDSAKIRQFRITALGLGCHCALPLTAWAHGAEIMDLMEYGYMIGFGVFLGLLIFCLFWRAKWRVKIAVLATFVLTTPLAPLLKILIQTVAGSAVGIIFGFGVLPLVISYWMYRVIQWLVSVRLQ